ncbi:MAG: Arc family DNA binding domain-containing protein [Elusimicrobia bacterium]|nr:Arc family DNA binding domain-containing protein [Elusimicrobiota bacterium]
MAERKSFLLRIDGELWREMAAWAEADLRSVNGQIEFVLKEAVRRRRGPAQPPPI